MQVSLVMQELADRLLPGEEGKESAQLFRVLLCELAAGRPVSRERLAELIHWPAHEVAAALERAIGVEYDGAGCIVGYGLTLRETPHAFEVGGRRLYTWCALDALMFPSLIGETARVVSSCAVPGAPIRLTVTPDGIRNLDPASATVSLILPDDSRDIRSAFCCQVLFFVSASAAESWIGTRKHAIAVSVEEAFGLGQELSRRSLLR